MQYPAQKLDDIIPSCADAFPTIADPPWRGRKTHWAGLAVPLILICIGGGALTLHLVFGSHGDNGGDDEIASLYSQPDAEARSRWRIASGEGSYAQESKPERRSGAGDGGLSQGPDMGSPDMAEQGDAGWQGLEGEDAGVEISGDVVTFRSLVGVGTTMSKRLSSHGLSAKQINQIVEALDGLFDFRKSRPRHRYVLEISKSEKQVQRFRYEVRSTEIYEVNRRGDRLRAHKVKVNVTYHKIRTGRRIEGSIAESINKAGLKRRVLNAFMRTFGRDINFRNKQQDGDIFRVIAVEERLDGEYVRTKEVSAVEYKGKAVGRLLAFYFQPEGESGQFYDKKGLSFERTRLRTPLNYTRISSPFNLKRMHPVLKRRVPHRGVDFAAPRGTHVWATADGEVRFIGRKGASGNLVIIRHAGGLESNYAHLQKFVKGLKRGQNVRQGQVIGYVGSTGRSTGPHLHFGLKKNGAFVDPMKIKTGSGVPIEREYRQAFLKRMRELLRELNTIRVQ